MRGGGAYRPDIDGLRAIAVAAVVAFHAFPEVAPGGFVGVDVFFVISGYLISGLLLGEKGGRLREFYARRVRRIFPALIVVLLGCLAFGWVALLPNEYDQLAQHVVGSGAFVQNFVLWRESGYFDVAASVKPLVHIWSLGIEEQFYLAWPLLLVLATRWRRSALWVIVPVIVLSYAYNLRTVNHDAIAAFYSPATRMWELAVGGLLACVVPRWRAVLDGETCAGVGLALIAASVVLLRDDFAFPGAWAALPVVGASLVILAGPETAVTRVLAWRPLVFIGLISYPLYLLHWPPLVFCRILASGSPSVAVRAAIVAGSIGGAWLVYRFVERPLRFGKRRHVVLALAVTMAAVVTAGIAVHALRGVPSRMPDALREIASADLDFTTDARIGRCWLGHAAPFDGFKPECIDPGTSPLVFVWGDSHAARLYPGIRATTDARIAQFTRHNCPPILDYGYPNCVASNAFVLGKIRDARPAVVLLFAAWNEHTANARPDDPVMRDLVHTVRVIHELGVPRVVVLGPAPKWNRALPRIMLNASRRDPLHALPQRLRRGYKPEIESLDAAISNLIGADYVSAWQAFCDADGCLTSTDAGVFSWDTGHLTSAGATYLARYLAARGVFAFR